jgi:hypothetical protein
MHQVSPSRSKMQQGEVDMSFPRERLEGWYLNKVRMCIPDCSQIPGKECSASDTILIKSERVLNKIIGY